MAPDRPRTEIRLPMSLAQVGGGERAIEVEGATLREALADLARRRPKLGLHLFDESGAMRRHIRCFCNDRYASHREGLDQPLCDGDKITLLNSVAGG